MASLSGKRVLITGAAGGIGFCSARRFAQAGCELVLTDIDEQQLRQRASELAGHGTRVEARRCDVSDRQQVEQLASWVTDELGGLDILINNAGIGHQAELAETSIEDWQRLAAVNLWGPLYHIYAFLPHMKSRRAGQIVNISSGQAFFRLPTWGAYASIKLALGAFSEVLHFELRKHGIKVTTIYPFMVNTGFYDEIEADTFGSKMAMKLVPLYSMSPERVGEIVFDAVRRAKKVEMVSMLNDVARYARVVPLVPDAIAVVSNWFLAKST